MIIRNCFFKADRKKSGKKFKGKSLTMQEFKDECNIRKMLERYEKKRTIRVPINASEMKFGNFSSGVDFKEMENKVIQAHHQFAALPAKVRNKFDNSPKKLIEFLKDEDNRDQAIKLGLIRKPEKKEPEKPVLVQMVKEDPEPKKE